MRSARVLADTNIIIRYLTNEPVEQAGIVETFLEELEPGKRELYICALVAAKAVYVLQSFYRRPKREIADTLKAFFSLRGVVVEQKQIVFTALDYYVKHNIDFTDAYIASRAQAGGIKKVFTFDKDFSVFERLV